MLESRRRVPNKVPSGMVDFRIALILTVGASCLTVAADWIASKLVLYTKLLFRLRKILMPGDAHERPIDRLLRARAEIERHDRMESCLVAWGTELAAVALSVDFVGLGIWSRTPNLFPFFEKFNEDGVSRETPVWLMIIVVHMVALCVSLVFKHNHVETIARAVPAEQVGFPRLRWFLRNKWMVASAFTGFSALLASIVVFTNAL